MSFSADLTRFARKAGLRADLVLRKVALDGLRGLLYRSPVGNPALWKNPAAAPPGYVGGRFRANWRVGVNATVLDTTESILPSGDPPLEITKIGTARFGDTIHITQNLDYAYPIEHEQHSTQALDGVLMPTFTELKARLRAAVAQARRDAP